MFFNLFCFFLLFLNSTAALAAGGPGAEFINYYEIILSNLFGMDKHHSHEWMAVLGGLLSLSILFIIGIRFKSLLAKDSEGAPSNKFGLQTFVEALLDFVFDLADDVIGAKRAPSFIILIVGIFLFIFISNLTGLVPGFPPATENINTNLAIGLTVFLVYNIAGLKEHGFGYVKQFLGPVWWLAPLMICIEVISHLARPLSLSLRLYGNIFGDHLVLSVFTGLSYLILPALLLFFGLLVAMLQSFVFALLTSIYISMAVSHDH